MHNFDLILSYFSPTPNSGGRVPPRFTPLHNTYSPQLHEKSKFSRDAFCEKTETMLVPEVKKYVQRETIKSDGYTDTELPRLIQVPPSFMASRNNNANHDAIPYRHVTRRYIGRCYVAMCYVDKVKSRADYLPQLAVHAGTRAQATFRLQYCILQTMNVFCNAKQNRLGTTAGDHAQRLRANFVTNLNTQQFVRCLSHRSDSITTCSLNTGRV